MTTSNAAPNSPTVCAAFSAGWLIAQLHGPILTRPVTAEAPLPTVRELGRADRVADPEFTSHTGDRPMPFAGLAPDLQHHPDRPLTQLIRILLRPTPRSTGCHSSILVSKAGSTRGYQAESFR